MKQPHEHIAAAYQGRTGSPYQVFRKPRRLTAWDLISTACVVVVFLALLCALPWEGGW